MKILQKLHELHYSVAHPILRYIVFRGPRAEGTDLPAYSDTLRTWEKCHCNQIVTVSRGSLLSKPIIWDLL